MEKCWVYKVALVYGRDGMRGEGEGRWAGDGEKGERGREREERKRGGRGKKGRERRDGDISTTNSHRSYLGSIHSSLESPARSEESTLISQLVMQRLVSQLVMQALSHS